jgi:hypothetical protein
MMTVGYSFNIWVPLLLFPTAGPNGAPRWKKGWPVTFVFYFLLLSGFLVSIVINRRYVSPGSRDIPANLLLFSEKRRLVVESESDDGSREREEIVIKANSNSKSGPQL